MQDQKNQVKNKTQLRPVVENMITGKNRVKVGGVFPLSVTARDQKGLASIASIDIRLNGKVVRTCEKVRTCSTIVGPFAKPGVQNYYFRITNTNGNAIEPWGSFTVTKN